jgi:hypothetical protein
VSRYFARTARQPSSPVLSMGHALWNVAESVTSKSGRKNIPGTCLAVLRSMPVPEDSCVELAVCAAALSAHCFSAADAGTLEVLFTSMVVCQVRACLRYAEKSYGADSVAVAALERSALSAGHVVLFSLL